MLSALIYDESSLRTVLLTQQSANQSFTQTGLLILGPNLLSFPSPSQVETKLFHNVLNPTRVVP